MDSETQALNDYKEQLRKVEETLKVTEDEVDRNNLLSLQSDLQQLIELTTPTNQEDNDPADEYQDEYALFMAEMQKEGAIETTDTSNPSGTDGETSESIDLASLEGTKCRAPHTHTWGTTVLHNALISSVLPHSSSTYDELKVKVLFINPTHKEMLPCPYYLDTECKFSDEKCRFSHGEVVLFSSLEEYIEPDFAGLSVGSFVLAKQADKLWHRGIVRRILKEKEMCIVKLDKDKSDVEVAHVDVLPLSADDVDELSDDEESETGDIDEESRQDFINLSLLITPSEDKLGSWEKHTKGIGSKLMEKMGYIMGTGLGRRAEGRIDPVTAVALPAGKSLDHCMELREKSGGDKNLFNVERKLKRLQRKQEQRNQKNYERESKKVDVFNFLNDTLSGKKPNESPMQLSKSQHRKEIKQETSRNLNVESFKIEQRIKEIQSELLGIKQSMQRQASSQASLHKQLNERYRIKEEELKSLQNKSQNIKHEQSLRNTTRKLTVF